MIPAFQTYTIIGSGQSRLEASPTEIRRRTVTLGKTASVYDQIAC
jgi:hypothetical protein